MLLRGRVLDNPYCCLPSFVPLWNKRWSAKAFQLYIVVPWWHPIHTNWQSNREIKANVNIGASISVIGSGSATMTITHSLSHTAFSKVNNWAGPVTHHQASKTNFIFSLHDPWILLGSARCVKQQQSRGVTGLLTFSPSCPPLVWRRNELGEQRLPRVRAPRLEFWQRRAGRPPEPRGLPVRRAPGGRAAAAATTAAAEATWRSPAGVPKDTMIFLPAQSSLRGLTTVFCMLHSWQHSQKWHSSHVKSPTT